MTGSAEATPSPLRLREGGVATLFLLAAALALYLISRTDAIFYAPQHPLYLVTAVLFALSSPGPLLRPWDLPGQILYWNAVGWAIGLVIFGLASVGSLPILTLILAAFALSFWPRTPESTMPWHAIAIALLGGLFVCWLAWGDVEFALPSEWNRG
jgi:hypothetical protein